MLLTRSADVVFVFDESSSSENGVDPQNGFAETRLWLLESIDDIASELASHGLDSVRYGLVGFGGDPDGDQSVGAYGHSIIVDAATTPVNERLSSSGSSSEQQTEIEQAISALDIDGGTEDGWDAIDHALAEYEFRSGAVPVLVLVQSDEGRVNFNTTLTSEGVEASLRSANALLNVIVPGAASNLDANDPQYFDLFSIASLGTGQRVVGVEADGDGDGLHRARIHTDSTSLLTDGSFDDGPGSLDSIVGEQVDTMGGGTPITALNNTADGETEDSYVRLAWETGGAAWDAGILDSRSIDAGGVLPDQALREAALREAFAESLAEQILEAHAAGRVYRSQNVVAAVNLGGPAVTGFAADPYTGPNVESTTLPLNTNTLSNSIPADIPDAVFQTVRTHTGATPLVIDIDTTTGGQAIPDGWYTVELLFNAPTFASGTFDVTLEGQRVLSAYNISNDYSVVTDPGGVELEVALTGQNRAVVKRYAVEVSGGDGLQVQIDHIVWDPATIAGVRLLKDAPRVTDITLTNTNSAYATSPSREASYAADLPGGNGNQLIPRPVAGADQIAIRFSQPVSMTVDALILSASDLALSETPPDYNDAVFTPPSASNDYTATWKFEKLDTGGMPIEFDLPSGKYTMRLDASKITSLQTGMQLDGEWINPASISTENALISSFSTMGDGQGGGDFVFAMSVLFDTDDALYAIDNGELSALLDAWGASGVTSGAEGGDVNGDGVVDDADLSQLLGAWGYSVADFIYYDFVDLPSGVIDVTDLNEVISLQIDVDGDGTFEGIVGGVYGDDVALVFAQLSMVYVA